MNTHQSIRKAWPVLWAICILSFAIQSCSDTTAPSAPRNYSPLTIGSWWVYGVAPIDTLRTDTLSPIGREDSAWVKSIVQRAGKVGVLVERLDDNGGLDSSIYRQENSRLYEWTSIPFLDGLASEIQPNEPSWMLQADFAKGNWTFDTSIADRELTSTTVPVNGFNLRVSLLASGTISISGRASATENVRVPQGSTAGRDTMVVAQRCESVARIRWTVRPSIPVPGLEIEPIELEVPYLAWHATDIGRVRYIQSPYSIRFNARLAGLAIPITSLSIPGADFRLQRYHIAP